MSQPNAVKSHQSIAFVLIITSALVSYLSWRIFATWWVNHSIRMLLTAPGYGRYYVHMFAGLSLVFFMLMSAIGITIGFGYLILDAVIGISNLLKADQPEGPSSSSG